MPAVVDLAAATAVTAVVGALAAILVGRAARGQRLGWASRVTVLRLGLVCALAGLVAAPAIVAASPGWLVGAAIVALGLDGLDGPIARRRGEQSALGALLDGETDAFFVLVLALHVARVAPAPLALGIGLLRYALLAAAAAWPRLRGPVPSSLRAKIICDTQIVVLVGCLVPGVPAAARAPALGVALALLAWSFSFDVRHLLARARASTPSP